MKKTYRVNTTTNFSIGDEEFYLKNGDEVDLPDHELIESMLIHKHLVKIAKPEQRKSTQIIKETT